MYTSRNKNGNIGNMILVNKLIHSDKRAAPIKLNYKYNLFSCPCSNMWRHNHRNFLVHLRTENFYNLKMSVTKLLKI